MAIRGSWEKPPRDSKNHFFESGQFASMCGQWMSTKLGELPVDGENCKICERAIVEKQVRTDDMQLDDGFTLDGSDE